ncbi:hypothetical protein [Vibrio vulnificus]|uniref:hypothetical protein n=1 Tax=Vibrio vulnificus TaxID=672 RepID=UPI00165E094A|nr:hypothetical protein [Vibrio vulnificus]
MTEPCMSNDSGHYQGSYSERTECGVIGAYDKGVPLGIVQKFVAGHKTYMMTLHYDNPSHAKVREYLEAARTKDSNVSDFEFIESEIDQVIEHFVTNQAYANNK